MECSLGNGKYWKSLSQTLTLQKFFFTIVYREKLVGVPKNVNPEVGVPFYIFCKFKARTGKSRRKWKMGEKAIFALVNGS